MWLASFNGRGGEANLPTRLPLVESSMWDDRVSLKLPSRILLSEPKEEPKGFLNYHCWAEVETQ